MNIALQFVGMQSMLARLSLRRFHVARDTEVLPSQRLAIVSKDQGCVVNQNHIILFSLDPTRSKRDLIFGVLKSLIAVSTQFEGLK